jgi:5-methylcytosine-specific restriction endonuclease McrBC regulatory subunit McrC
MPRLARLSRDWSDVVSRIASGAIDSAVALGAPPVGYRTALQLARLLLVGAGIDTVGGNGGDAFLLNISILWEEAVRRMADSWARSASWISVHNGERSRRWDDERQLADPARWLKVDALLRSADGSSLVLDAKYKRQYGVEDRSDRFQIATYCLAFGAGTGVLIYPIVDETQPSENRLLLRSSLAGAPAEIRSLALPIAAGPLRCAQVLSQHLDHIVSSPGAPTHAPL